MKKAQWIAGLKADHQASVHQQPQVTISEDDLRRRVNRMKNWTAPGPDMIHTYWLKKVNITSQKAGLSNGETGS